MIKMYEISQLHKLLVDILIDNAKKYHNNPQSWLLIEIDYEFKELPEPCKLTWLPCL